MGQPRSSVRAPSCESWALVSRRLVRVPALVALVCCAVVLAWCWWGGAGVTLPVWQWRDAVMVLVALVW